MLPIFQHIFKNRNIQQNSITIAEENEDSDKKVTDSKLPACLPEQCPEQSSEVAKTEPPVDENETVVKLGIITEIFDDNCYTINIPEDELFVTYSDDLKTQKWNFIKNDKVRFNLSVKYEDFGIPINKVTSMTASKITTELGRVTAIDDQFITFENKVVLIKSSMTNIPDLTIGQKCNYSKIESDQHVNGYNLSWRIVEIISICAQEVQNVVDMESGVTIEPVEDFIIKQSLSSVENKFITILNTSNDIVDVKVYFDPPVPELIKMGRESFTLRPKNGAFKAYFNIFPRKIGKFTSKFVADLRSKKSAKKAQKTCEINVEIRDDLVVLKAPRSNFVERFEDIKIPTHKIPLELKNFDFQKLRKQPKTLIESLIESYPFLGESSINPTNYLEKMRFSIYLDEIAMEIAFEAYRLEEAKFEDCDGLLRLNVKDVAERRPSLIVGDSVEVSLPLRNDVKNNFLYDGRIRKVENDSILIKFHDEFHRSYHGKYTVEFKFSRSAYNIEQYAIGLAHSKFGFDFLFPSLDKVVTRHPQLYASLQDGKLIEFCRERTWFDKNLNHYQKEAVVNALRNECRPLPYVIYGPPGTGKTKTIIELITQLFVLDPTSHIIVATPSNSAANIFTEALINSQVFSKTHDFIRFVSHNQVERELIPDYLHKYCATIKTESDNGRKHFETTYSSSGIRFNCTKTQITNYRICIGTLSCLSKMLKIKFPPEHFKHIIIDEAGQCTEAETLLAINLMSKDVGQVILAGDPLQLGPISISRWVERFNLNFSLLERLLTDNECYSQNEHKEYDKRFVTKLLINYRSTPSVLSLYNDLFYNKELQGNIKEGHLKFDIPSVLDSGNILWKNIGKNVNCGVYFVNVVKGKNRRDRESCSWCNDAEISSVSSFLHKLSDPSGIKFDFKDIGIITPYSLQVKKFQKKISVGFSDTDLKIGTVEEFQGQERDIILLSTVRTEEKYFGTDTKFNLGFLQCQKRLNVALSRARSLLIIFGKGEVLEKIEIWKRVIDFTKENGTYVVDDKT